MSEDISNFHALFENLDDDPYIHESTMEKINCYVKELDLNAIPWFLSQLSKSGGQGKLSDVYILSLYESIVQLHGSAITSQIDIIVSSIMKSLKSPIQSPSLYEACSKVIAAIAKYCIEPATRDGENKKIVYALCKPLSDHLMCSLQLPAIGAAFWLKGIAESDYWWSVPNDIVNDVCLKITGALQEKVTQTIEHMSLVMTLVSRNSLIIEAYARSLIVSGLHILSKPENSQEKRMKAVEMINHLLKTLEIGCIDSELDAVVKLIETCQLNPNTVLGSKAMETLQTARMLISCKGKKEVFDSNIGIRKSRDIIQKYTSRNSSLITWNDDDDGVDGPLKNEILSPFDSTFYSSNIFNEDVMDNEIYDTAQEYSGHLGTRGITRNHQMQLSEVHFDDMKISSNPIKPFGSLEDPFDTDPSASSHTSSNVPHSFVWNELRRKSTTDDYDFKLSRSNSYEFRPQRNYDTGQVVGSRLEQGESEFVSSTDDNTDNINRNILSKVDNTSDDTDNIDHNISFKGGDIKSKILSINTNWVLPKISPKVICCFSLIIIAVIWSFWIENPAENSNYVPT